VTRLPSTTLSARGTEGLLLPIEPQARRAAQRMREMHVVLMHGMHATPERAQSAAAGWQCMSRMLTGARRFMRR
jgi:hypothetical protein